MVAGRPPQVGTLRVGEGVGLGAEDGVDEMVGVGLGEAASDLLGAGEGPLEGDADPEVPRNTKPTPSERTTTGKTRRKEGCARARISEV
jgi:hypothetical protein